MSWLIIAVGAQIAIGISLVFDKVLLKRALSSPLAYTFWLAILGGFGLLLLPFGFQLPSFQIAALAILAGLIFIAAIFFNYLALNAGESSRTLPIIGGLSPIFTLIFSYLFIAYPPLNSDFLYGFGFLIFGAVIFLLIEKTDFRRIIFYVISTALLFGLSNIFTKIIFENVNFITGFALIKIGGIFGVSLLLFRSSWRQKIFSGAKIRVSHQYWYLGNRALAGFGSVLIYYAISLSQPALVDAVGSLRYAIIFLAALILTRFRPDWIFERFKGLALFGKIIATLLVSLGIFFLAISAYFESHPASADRQIIWGATFSKRFSQQLGLDWKENYLAILNDLKIRQLRLVAYWPEIQPQPDAWDYKDLDWQMDEAAKAGAKVILVVGQKVPRWPECHIPPWAGNSKFRIQNSKLLLRYIEQVVQRYRINPALLAWQVENEPFLKFFGECPPLDEKFFEQEIALVKSLDSDRQIVLTDSGEFGTWYQTVRRADVFGTTLYHKVYNRIFGNISYPLSPNFYRLKEKIIRLILNERNKKFIIIELGLEPWGKHQIYEMLPDEQLSLFSFDDFKKEIEYAKAADFDTYYFWGVEWWYWLKENQHAPEFWSYAKDLNEGKP